jgi:hypothetical protein
VSLLCSINFENILKATADHMLLHLLSPNSHKKVFFLLTKRCHVYNSAKIWTVFKCLSMFGVCSNTEDQFQHSFYASDKIYLQHSRREHYKYLSLPQVAVPYITHKQIRQDELGPKFLVTYDTQCSTIET